MKRRSFVQGAAATAFLSLTSSFGVTRLLAVTNHITPTRLRFPSAFNGETVAVNLGASSIWDDGLTETYRFGGYPGVTIKKNKGEMHSLMVHNLLATPLAVHWHGLDVPSIMDGHPMDAIDPDATKEYRFEVKNRAGTYFYHSHSHQRTGKEVNRGLVGLFIVSDAEEQALQLPSGSRDIPLLIQDVRVDDQHRILYGPSMVDRTEGWLGNTILVNGTPNAYHVLEPAWHRVRLVNGSNARIYDLKLSDGSAFVVIGGDGGLLERPQTVTSVKLAPSERADVLIDFARYASGSSVKLQSGAFTVPIGHMGVSQYPQGVPYDILRFDIVGTPDTSFTVPQTLSTIPPLPDVSGIPVRTIELSMTMMGGMKHTINNLVFDMYRTDFEILQGATEVWKFVNKEADMMHPIHVHGRQFRILSRSSGNLAAHETGYKDTVLIGPGETVRVLVTATDYEGMSLLHCHNLEHEDDGMMINFMVAKAMSVDAEAEQSFNMVYDGGDEVLRVTAANHIGQTLVVTNLQGAEVLSAWVSIPEIAVDVRGLPAGSYILSLGRYSRTFLLVR